MTESRNALLWLNGALVPAHLARIDPTDRGLTLGDGLFETIRAVNGRPRHLAQHLARLRGGAMQLGIELPLSDTEITSALAKTLTANHLLEAVIRLTLTRGAAPRGVAPSGPHSPTLLITASAFAPPAPECSAIISCTTRRNEFSPLANLKSLNYLDNIIARREASQRGADDAILLNTQGAVAEATAANLFLLKDGNWLTPRAADGALPGIFRARLLARNIAREEKITEAALFSAAAICLGNALAVRSISTLDGRHIKSEAQAIAELREILAADD